MKKRNKSSANSSRLGLRFAALLAIGLLLAGLYWCLSRLHDLWIESAQITNVAEQITLTGNDYVPSDAILSTCGLTNGANLARLSGDFEEIRTRVLTRLPNLRDISFVRHLPNRLDVKVTVREPIARMRARSAPKRTGRVVDEDGVVFLRIPRTQLLPEIIEETPTLKGNALEGRTRAALDLVLACREPELEKLSLRAVDATSPDYLLITFGTTHYDRAKVDWEGRGEATEKARKTLQKTLLHLKQAVDTRLGDRAVMWNATIPNRIFADTKEPIQ